MYATTLRAESSFAQRLISSLQRAQRALTFAAPAGDVLLRLWVAAAFFKSGLAKVTSLETTILLFEYEYQVPVLSPVVAAYLSTAGELGFSALLVLGLFGRLAALGLFFVNVVAVISYPALMEHALQMHYAWGLVLLVLVLRGPGKLSIDHVAARRLGWQ
jgi:putative oxidoreductase